ncbi:ribosomal l32p family protein [Rutstroemia sp. NJR-2017a BBW]|nr:ribosomal l32p family protein [Rutstroemia sp. NJR-2017a BBW]
MAATHATTTSILSSFLPRLAPQTVSIASRSIALYSRQLSHPLLPAFAIPSAIHLNVPGLLEGLWESILKAVPKKKTSHMKKRHRQMAGKGLKDVTSLNRCSACGHIKRAHLLCPYCVNGEDPKIKMMFKGNAKQSLEKSVETAKAVEEQAAVTEDSAADVKTTELQK